MESDPYYRMQQIGSEFAQFFGDPRQFQLFLYTNYQKRVVNFGFEAANRWVDTELTQLEGLAKIFKFNKLTQNN
jgi:hypothetical protein